MAEITTPTFPPLPGGNGDINAPSIGISTTITQQQQQHQQQLDPILQATAHVTHQGQAKEQSPVVMPVENAPTGSGKPATKTPLTFSYSQMVKRHGTQHHSKNTTKEIWKNIRSARSTIASTPCPPVFIRTNRKHIAAVVFGFSGVRADLVHKAILDMETGGNYLDFEDDRALIHFSTLEKYNEFLERKVEVNDFVFQPQQTLYTTGKPLLIRAHHVANGSNTERQQYLQSTFDKAGVIRHIDFQVVQSGSSTMATPIVDFVLDITHPQPDQIWIPRLANIEGINCLFTWSNMGEICYQCGADDHVKSRCTQQENYTRAPAIPAPQYSRAFSPTAPKPPKEATASTNECPSVNYGTSRASTFSSPPSSQLTGEWQTQGRKSKTAVKRPTQSTSSDTEKPPATDPSTKKSKTTHKRNIVKAKAPSTADQKGKAPKDTKTPSAAALSFVPKGQTPDQISLCIKPSPSASPMGEPSKNTEGQDKAPAQLQQEQQKPQQPGEGSLDCGANYKESGTQGGQDMAPPATLGNKNPSTEQDEIDPTPASDMNDSANPMDLT